MGIAPPCQPASQLFASFMPACVLANGQLSILLSPFHTNTHTFMTNVSLITISIKKSQFMPHYLFIHFGFEVFFIFTLSIQNDKFKPGVMDFMSCHQIHYQSTGKAGWRWFEYCLVSFL